jgi:hypothetical protein
MVVENLGLSFALHWFYSTFSSSSHSHETAVADAYPSRDQREKYKNSSLSNDDYSIGADDDVASELPLFNASNNSILIPHTFKMLAADITPDSSISPAHIVF